MVIWLIIKNIMLPLFFLVASGFVLDRKFNMNVQTLSKLIFYLIIPSFIFTNVYGMKVYANSMNFTVGIIVLILISGMLGTVVGKCCHYDGGMLQVCRNALMFNNAGNLGVALIILVFSNAPFAINGKTPYLEEALAAQIIAVVVQAIAINTIGLYLTARGKLSTKETMRAVFRMPIIYSFVLALIIRYVAIDASSSFLWPIMELLSKAILPLSMISLGVQLSQAKIGWKNHDVWIVSSLKLFVLPLIGIALIYTANTFVPGFFTPVGAIVFLIYSAIPSAVNVALYSIEFNNNSDYATQVVMTTTTISAFSLTICIMIGHKLFV